MTRTKSWRLARALTMVWVCWFQLNEVQASDLVGSERTREPRQTPRDEARPKNYLGSSLLGLPSLIPGDGFLFFEVDYGRRVGEQDFVLLAADWYEYRTPLSGLRKYPGHVVTYGPIVGYQWFFWDEFFLLQLVNPLVVDYIGESGGKLQTGFMLLFATRVGYRFEFALGEVPLYLELGGEISYWPVNTNVPPDFKEIEDLYSNYAPSPSLNAGVMF